jgi:hypothetical protein
LACRSIVQYSLHVGKDKELHAIKDILNIMTKGDVYAVYYCNAASEIDQEGEDNWDKILSVEFIAKAPPETIQADGQGGFAPEEAGGIEEYARYQPDQRTGIRAEEKRDFGSSVSCIFFNRPC